ncbi:unnamed protein product [Rotaria socialis]|uniref:Uncharacterized protein n=2 Tax=Rotaria socialis TaxID=392032 RepID=A0A818C7D7_9BILA|nr:unnamed protein product [Rotaria socialis]
MAMIQANRIGIKDVGSTANVPNNDIAKLMYYFKCVCGAIECNMTPQMNRLSSYNSWRYLSADEIRQLIALCYVFSPDVFEDKVFFNSPALCGNSSNKFYEISQVRNQLLAVSSIVISGQSRRVNKIMIIESVTNVTPSLSPITSMVSANSNNLVLPPTSSNSSLSISFDSERNENENIPFVMSDSLTTSELPVRRTYVILTELDEPFLILIRLNLPYPLE